MESKQLVRQVIQTCSILNATKILYLNISPIGQRRLQTKPSQRKTRRKYFRKKFVGDRDRTEAIFRGIYLIRKELFGRCLLLTNTLSMGTLMMIGDYFSQKIEFRINKSITSKHELNWSRMRQMFLVGCLLGPSYHFFYKWLDHAVPAVTLKTTVYKILLDQLIMSPVNDLLFLYSACLLEGGSLTEANDEVQRKFLPIYFTDCVFSPPFQFLNFFYFPPKYRVLYVNVFILFFNTFLSFYKHLD